LENANALPYQQKDDEMTNQWDKSKPAVIFILVAILGFAMGGWVSPQSHESAQKS
jgi:hypothetical protein